MRFVQIEQQKITFDQIALKDYQVRGDYHQKVLDFCHAWLNGQTTFTLHTSGSTGKPKPITLQREQLLASIWMTDQALGLQAMHNALVCINTEYIGGKMMLARCLELGLNMYVVKPSSNPFQELPDNLTIDFSALVPLQLQQILEHPQSKYMLNSLQSVIVGGAPVSQQLQKELQALNVLVYQTYGMTETVSHIALKALNGNSASTLYHTLDQVKISLDERNCLVIEAPSTNFAKIITNDVVKLHSENSFEWIGRYDHVINSGGVKIQLEEVERAVENLFAGEGYTANFLLGAVPDQALGEKLVLLMEDQPWPQKQQDQLTRQLRQKMDKYHMPKAIHFLEEFPKTASGKTDRTRAFQAIEQD
ncbi:AMP-binding protein [Rapidithrix thailandica]|uniref:AMP-binding protein n=1 Tax=Rapidithrix thailandica TaxID=413964 RepID=A0AAW9RVB7_9BACT